MMNILITGAFMVSSDKLETLKKYGNITLHKSEYDNVLNPEIYDIVICNSLFLYNDIKKFTNLKFIQLTSVGYDRVPVDYCRENSILILNAGDIYAVPMAEWTVLKILEIYKNSGFFYSNKQNKKWEKDRSIIELSKKTACIVGFGNVGSKIATRLKAFDVKILAVDVIDIKSDFADESFLIDNIKDALVKSDIVILTLPLTDKTKNMFSKEMFSFMKDKSVLVNISRGGIINEEDLIYELKNNKFKGVALDVFNKEPLEDTSPLWGFENVYITPHNSFISDNNEERLFNLVKKNIDNYTKKGYIND